MADQDPYPLLAQIQDHHLRLTLRLVFDQLSAVRRGTQPAKGPRDSGGHRITKMADPVEDADAVTLGYVKKHFGASALRSSLKAGGTTALDVNNLTGRLADPQVPFLRDYGDNPLPDTGTARPGTLIRQGGVLWMFSGETNQWVQVTT